MFMVEPRPRSPYYASYLQMAYHHSPQPLHRPGVGVPPNEVDVLYFPTTNAAVIAHALRQYGLAIPPIRIEGSCGDVLYRWK